MKHKTIRHFLLSILALILLSCGTAPRPVLAASPVIRSVSISPGSAAATRDSTCAFTVSVVGENNYSREVAWSVTGQTSRNTFIDGNGILNISADELSTSLVVKAVSKQDSRYSATALVSLPKPTCQINVKASPDNAGTVTESRAVDYGGSITLEASAREGYTFDHWMENNAILGTEAKLTLNNVTQAREITAIFSKNRFDLTLNCSPAYSGTVTGQGTYNRGTSVRITATPIQGYRFVGWSENGNIIYVNAEYDINNIADDRNLTAVFEMEGAVTYTINASISSGSGTITPEGTTRITQGSGILYTITPANGYTVSNVSVDGSPVGAVSSYTFNDVKGDHSITADFAALPVQEKPAPAPVEQSKPDKQPEQAVTDPEPEPSPEPSSRPETTPPEAGQDSSLSGKPPAKNEQTDSTVPEDNGDSNDPDDDDAVEESLKPADEKREPPADSPAATVERNDNAEHTQSTVTITPSGARPGPFSSQNMTTAVVVLSLILATAATIVLIVYIVRKQKGE